MLALGNKEEAILEDFNCSAGKCPRVVPGAVKEGAVEKGTI
jgi:hypothetical protein